MIAVTDVALAIRIELVDPPEGYAFCLQRGKGSRSERLDYVEVLEGDNDAIVFDLDVTVRKAKSGSEPDVFGPFVQGPRGARFFYICVGQCVAGAAPHWSGRVKVPLAAIDWASVQSATADHGCLFARFAASRPGGGPTLASVPLLDDGWVAVQD